MSDQLRSYDQFHVREMDEESGVVTAVISTGNVARDGAIIETSGWELDNYLRNPAVLLQHNDFGLPIGRTTEIHVDGDQLVATAQIDTEDERGAELLSKIRRGFIWSTSVRWNPFETEWREVRGEDSEEPPVKTLVFLRQELLEWSFVTVPADPGATIVRADTGERYAPVYTTREQAPPAPEPEPKPEPTVEPESRRYEAQVGVAIASLLERRQKRPALIRNAVVTALAAKMGLTEERMEKRLNG